MPFVHIPSGAAGEVLAAAIALFVILLAAFLAAIGVIACRARNPVLAQRACQPRIHPAAEHAPPAAHPQGGTP
jgi:hypothetical protein